MSPCSFAQMFASMIRGYESEGRNKSQFFKNSPKTLAEFFTDLSQELESAATTQPRAETNPEDSFLMQMYQTKKKAMAWLASMAFGWFGESEEEEEEAYCKISTRYNGCLNIANGRVGEYLQP